MGKHYSPKSFFRHVPNAMLMRYFGKTRVLTEHDFSKVSEARIEPIYEAWLLLPNAQQRKIERDFKEIDALACEGGIKAIIDEAERHGEKITETMSQKEGFHEKAFWVFFERPKYWAGASAFYRADSIHSRHWDECRTINCAPAQVDDRSIQALEKALSHYFHNKEGRGRNCTVEPYRRGNLDYFFAYPEDYADSSIEWEEDGLKRSARHPAFEIIFVYSQKEGKISLYMKGSRDTKKEIRALFADAILGLELGEFVEDERVYDLSSLHDSSLSFMFSPDSGIESVVIRKLRLVIDGTRKRLTLEVGPEKNPDAVYEFRDQSCQGIPKSQMTITQAGIVVGYIANAETGKTRKRSFEITWPNSCSLRHEGIDAIIRKMLVDSGIEPRVR